MSGEMKLGESAAGHGVKWAGLLLGPVLGALAYALLPATLTHEARSVGALAAWMACWWMTEALPISATALLPLVVLPLTGARTIGEASAPYADPIIYLFLGGFIVGEAMQKWGLHRRIALLIVLGVGTSPRRLVAGVMLATACISMFVSNTATAVMMVPIGLSLLAVLEPGREKGAASNLSIALMLGIAYSASIGGLGTIIGTPPNGVLVAQVKRAFGEEITFLEWMRIGVPLVAVLLPIAWFYLVYVASPVGAGESGDGARSAGREALAREFASLGPMKTGEKIVLCTFGAACALWMLPPGVRASLGVPGLNDSTVAIVAALLLFAIPVSVSRQEFVVDWAAAERLPWGVLVLFGGGLSLAAAMSATGLDAWLAGMFKGLGGVPVFVLVLVVCGATVFFSELASNTAVATAFLPVLAGAAVGMGMHPYQLMIPAALAATCGFMLPAGTPPNAIVFASGAVPLKRMIRHGFAFDVACVIVITVLMTLVGSVLVGEDLSTPPAWGKSLPVGK